MRHIEGLYAITPEMKDTDALADQVRRALDGGARMVQYRAKLASSQLRRAQAVVLAELCRARAARFIVNDGLALAREMGADGVHLGKDDASIDEARAMLGENAIIGVSCYNRFDLAVEAERKDADYAAFGSFFSSPTKPLAVRAAVELLHRAKRELNIPVVAIGGVTLDNAPLLTAAGADSIAVSSALFNASDIEFAARQFAALFSAR
jgi:thiamine-phosphate pyrophosphorylase